MSHRARVSDDPGEPRPRVVGDPSARSRVWALGDRAGLSRMGVAVRRAEPGFATTARHYHDVEEEWVYVLAGSGTARIGRHCVPVRPGSFVAYPPGPVPHHVVATGAEALVLLEGGERRKSEDSGRYTDVNFGWRHGKPHVYDTPLALEDGDPARCVHVDTVATDVFQHDVDAGARREQRALSRSAGLARQVVVWARVRAGERSTAYHTHDRTDEWVYVLQGRARARVGRDVFEVGPHDLLAHPAGGPAHVMEPLTDLTYLMGGMRDPDDVVTYPAAGVERRGGRIVPTKSS